MANIQNVVNNEETILNLLKDAKMAIVSLSMMSGLNRSEINFYYDNVLSRIESVLKVDAIVSEIKK